MNRTVTTGVIQKIMTKDGVTGHMVIACPLMAGKKAKDPVKVNYPVIEFNSKTKPAKIGTAFKGGDRVKVIGHMQSYIRKNDKGATESNDYIYADEVTYEESKFAKVFGVKGRIYDTQVNDVYLSGTVSGMNKLPQSQGYEVFLDPEGEEKNRLRIVYFKKSDDFENSIRIGAKIAVVAMIQSQTVPDVSNKAGYSFQNTVASDIVKMEG